MWPLETSERRTRSMEITTLRRSSGKAKCFQPRTDPTLKGWPAVKVRRRASASLHMGDLQGSDLLL